APAASAGSLPSRRSPVVHSGASYRASAATAVTTPAKSAPPAETAKTRSSGEGDFHNGQARIGNSNGWHSFLGRWSNVYFVAAGHGADSRHGLCIQRHEFTASLWVRRCTLRRNLERGRIRKRKR